MTTEKYETCLIMARSFINEFIIKNELRKRRHSELFGLNDKLKFKLKEIATSHKMLEQKAERSAKTTLEKFEVYVADMTKDKDDNKKEIEANSLAFGLGFLFILIENDSFKMLSERMYFKRVCNELFYACEKESSPVAIHNANKLIHLFDEDTN